MSNRLTGIERRAAGTGPRRRRTRSTGTIPSAQLRKEISQAYDAWEMRRERARRARIASEEAQP